jgi:hypothetical protein
VAVFLIPWVVVSLCSLPRDRITKHNYDRIEMGMTLPEVESILGRRWTPGSLGAVVVVDGPVAGIWTPHREQWIGFKYSIIAHFDDEGKLTKKDFGRVINRQTYFEKIRQWLGV